MAHVADQKIINMVTQLVSDDHKAVDLELGLCRFCFARVESYDPHDLESHRPDCPWQGVRRELGLA